MQRDGRRLLGNLWLWGSTMGVAVFYGRALWQLASADPRTAATVQRVSGELPPPHPLKKPPVSILLPARNEELNIRACVESLLSQDYPNVEVIVIDDDSTDATPRVLDELQRQHPRRDRLHVVHAGTLPEGWAGKPHAIQVGAERARGEWLLLTDADTRHRPDALSLSLAAAQIEHLDLLTIETTQDLPTFWDRVLMPLAFLGISMQYDSRAINNPDSPLAIANGQYLLIRRELYDRVGGYASPRLRHTLVDDRDLAAEAKRAGGRLAFLPAPDLVHTRMYRSFREIYAGWSKNAFVGSRGGVPFYLAMVLGLPITGILPFAYALAGLQTRNRRLAAHGLAQTGILLYYRDRLNRRMGVPPRYAWTHPLASAIFTSILLRSWRASATGKSVAWRGRSYTLRP